MSGDQPGPVEDQHARGTQQHPHPAADVAGGHRVLALPHGDPGVPVHPGSQGQPGLERLGRQGRSRAARGRSRDRRWRSAARSDGGHPWRRTGRGRRSARRSCRPPASGRGGCGGTGHPRPRRHPSHGRPRRRDGSRTRRTRSGTGTHPPVRLDPGAAEQHPRHRRLQVVVADVDRRDPAELLERVRWPSRNASCAAVAYARWTALPEYDSRSVNRNTWSSPRPARSTDQRSRPPPLHRRVGLRHEHLDRCLPASAAIRRLATHVVADRRVGHHSAGARRPTVPCTRRAV